MGATKRPHTYRLIALLRSKCSSAALRRSGAQHMTATEAAISFPCHAAVPASLLTSARQSSTIICCCWTVINPYGYGCCRLPERNQALGGSEPAGICDVSVEQLHALVCIGTLYCTSDDVVNPDTTIRRTRDLSNFSAYV